MDERWRPVAGHEGRYEVSDLGRVRALFRARGYPPPPRILAGVLHEAGYRIVCLSRGRRGADDRRYVHSLVLETFDVPRPAAGMEGRHLNGDPTDSRLVNLAWGTSAENKADSVRHGTRPMGSRHPGAKLTEGRVLEIKALLAGGVRQVDIAEMFGVSFQLISLIKRGKVWRQVQMEKRGFQVGSCPVEL